MSCFYKFLCDSQLLSNELNFSVDTDTMDEIATSHGKCMFGENGFFYYFQKNLKDDKKRFLCHMNRRTKCPASVHVKVCIYSY